MNFLVSPYNTLLFSRKEIIKFSEGVLVSVHCNYLIGCIVVVWGYRSLNTANATADICLLVENGYKNTETKCKIFLNVFYQPFFCPKANFGPMTRRQPHSPYVNHNTTSRTTRRSLRASYLVMSLGSKAWLSI